MNTGPEQVRTMLHRYGKQLTTARRLARREATPLSPEEQAEKEMARSVRRRMVVEQVAREIVDNLLPAGSGNELVQLIREELEGEVGSRVELVFPPGELGVHLFIEQEGALREAGAEERDSIMRRLWEITLNRVNETMM